jgi:hypothetical protein
VQFAQKRTSHLENLILFIESKFPSRHNVIVVGFDEITKNLMSIQKKLFAMKREKESPSYIINKAQSLAMANY